MRYSGEQSYLFQLYSMLEEPAVCPRGCGTVIARHKSDFFALFVRPHPLWYRCVPDMTPCSQVSSHTLGIYDK